ncbi:hypothetical protein PACTADRAFT_3872 [Pachysolen tannophilus NRRL Y-2460]|uniref:Phospholipid/glycerol acyltransferase domain-containing protein n=1 Tax=Pachysolen tannophilus NRRL Y-2460 TaxID=669874 RepID=A0A1E4TTB5_PACTA|nr:hypothetical protein PACTADRAFT_3872 [Pachysolen tannophilus NRRL Y-2460]
MEKFTNWRDKSTGISPFLQPNNSRVNKSSSLLAKIFFITTGSITAIIKLPILIILLFLFLILKKIGLGKPILRVLLLLVFNLNEIDVSVNNVKKSQKKLIEFNLPDKNDICVVNYSSPLDCLILYLISKGQHDKMVYLISDNSGNLREYSMLSFMNHALSKPILFKDSNNGIIENLDQYKDKIVFIFPEGTTSNNKSILPFNKNLIKISNTTSRKIKIINLNKSNIYITSMPMTFLRFNTYNLMNFNEFGKYKVKIFVEEAETAWSVIRKILTNNNKLKLVGEELNIESKVRFIDAFEKNKDKI